MASSRRLSKPLQLIIFVAIGIILILTSIIVKQAYPTATVWTELLNSLGNALIIGPALSWILDLPSMINYFKHITVESLISKEYLNNLDRDKLVALRKDCTVKIHLKDSDTVEKELINVDENICELLTKPFCERFRQNTSFHKANNVYKKKHYIEELYRNPLNSRVSFSNFPKTYLDLSPGKTVDDIYKFEKFTVKIDDGVTKDITSDVKLVGHNINEPDIHFNTVVTLEDKSGNPLSFDYTNTLEINRIIIIETPAVDNTFIKRVTIPVKSFKIDYGYSGNDLKLIGSCFGTLSYSNDGGMKIIQGGSYISIESFTWLLPGNGVMIVKIPK